MGLNFKKWFKDEENDVFGVDGVEDSYYALITTNSRPFKK